MNEMPVIAMTLAVVALFAEGLTAIRNIYNWRVKETERIKAESRRLWSGSCDHQQPTMRRQNLS